MYKVDRDVKISEKLSKCQIKTITDGSFLVRNPNFDPPLILRCVT